MTLQQFLLALRGRLSIFVALVVATVAAAALVSVLLPKKYDATVSVLLANRDEQSLTTAPQGLREQIGYMQTQIDVIQSQRTARRVVEDLGLAKDPGAQRAFAASGAPGAIEDWLAAGLLTALKVDSSQSSVVNITYSARDPRFATQVANAFAQAYMEVNLKLRTEPTKQAAAWFDDQLKGLRKNFADAQERLSAFQKAKGIIANDERVDVENARLAELSSQMLKAQDEAFNAQTHLKESTGTPIESLPEVLANPMIQTLKAEVLRGEAKLQELSTRLGPNHPEYRQQASENAALRSRLHAEMAKVVGGMKSASQQSGAHLADLQQALAAQRAKVVQLREARDQALVLQRDVDTAQKAYEAALQRYLVNKVESGARQTNITILNPATEPTAQSRPKVKLNIVLGLLVGLVLGFGVVFLLELIDRRVRSTLDLEAGLDAPLLATLKPWHPSGLLGGPGAPRALPRPA